ncbi:hypothetical protein GUITHDRAFT_131546 [Guillardia theta CCMP2712]|uniref:Cyclic nucleotide-binding domain-containing protein n=1 Tax=Guillardia theta (strain CCMP2712) TaxID=905079 RepID=L1K3E9_GUITC|nr:hypothetical protein GUITHDRAFT_131546 [Guillardia theta CCMP2712]EKX55316.1 hypothetical protein GUITHDRAFT_131546 [Guillardia theta CCMP2712]|eukprot:XP_005842296.1 hypothetical protein GUITHDRAFT_131546 [Guillardia theta CCMP2712]
MSLFRNLTRKELRQVAASSSVRQFAPRNIICKKGTRAKQLFLVLSGEVLECSESNLSQRMFSSGAATGLMSALLGRELDVTWVAGRRGSLIGSIPSYAFGKVIEDHGQEFAETIMQQGLQCLSPARGFCSSAKVNFLSFVLDRFKDSNRLACIRSNLTRSLGLTLLRTCFYGWNLTLLTSQRSRVLSIRRRQRYWHASYPTP